MRGTILTVYTVLLIGSMNMPCFGQDSGSGDTKEYPRPERFAKDIQSFEAADKKQPPPKGAIVCIGSSSMRGWHGTIRNDLAPLTVILRGFGGSNMNDVLHFADRIVLPYEPRAVVVYEGDNDIAQGIAPEKVADTFRAFVTKVQDESPNCRIYFLSIKPSIRRWGLWPEMKETNSLIDAECTEEKRLTFVDVACGMLDDEGNPRKDIFKEDKLHMTRGGYVIWRDALRPILLKKELQFEPQNDTITREPKNEISNKPIAGEGK